jgi:hypothetical protein
MARAVAQGWRIERTTQRHWRFCPPDRSRPMVVTGDTSGDQRSVLHFVSQLRKSGFRD